MTRIRQLFIAAGVLVGLLLIAALWSANWMSGQQTRARQAAEDLQASAALVEQIESLMGEPKIAAADESRGIQELDPKIGRALQAAGLPRRPTIESIFPQAAREVGNAPYRIKPTAVSIRSVTLAQLATFLYHLSDGTGLNVRDLRMRAARSGNAQQWDAQATLTYLIYAPSDENR